MAAAQSKDRNSQFQSQLLEIWQKLSQSLNPPAPEPLKLNEAIERWWWTKSEGAFKQFETDSYAQGYELLRRLQQYRHQVFFYSHQKQNWPDLHCTDHLLFRSQYRSELTKLGLVKSIGYSAKAIEFDCRLPATYLIEALKEELRRPAPFIAGTYEWSLVPSAMDVKEQSVNAYTKQRKIWELAFAPKPHLIRLPLPESALEGDQYLNYFRTFVKDRPPAPREISEGNPETPTF
jgi:hypothetical protein